MVQKKQLSMNRKSQEQKIAVQIRNSVDDLESNKQKVETAKVARQLAEVQLDAETIGDKNCHAPKLTVAAIKMRPSQRYLLLYQRPLDIPTLLLSRIFF